MRTTLAASCVLVLACAATAHAQDQICAASTEQQIFDTSHAIGEIRNARITETVLPFGRRMNGEVVIGDSIDVSAAAEFPLPSYNPACPFALDLGAFATIEFDLVASQPFDLKWMIYGGADMEITGPGLNVDATAGAAAAGGSAIVNGELRMKPPSVAFDNAAPIRAEAGEYHVRTGGRWNHWDLILPQVRMTFSPVPIPEPSTWAVGLAAIATLAAVARCNRAHTSH